MPEAERAAGRGMQMRDVGAAVVREYCLHADAAVGEVGDRAV